MRLACVLVLATCVPALADPKPSTKQVRHGRLVDDLGRKSIPHCGGFMVWTVVQFDLEPAHNAPKKSKPALQRAPVAIACIELTRKQMGPNAGNAGVVAQGRRYKLHLDNYGTGSWGQAAYEAVRIDDAK